MDGSITFLVNIYWCKFNFLSSTFFRFSWNAKKICRLSRCVCRMELYFFNRLLCCRCWISSIFCKSYFLLLQRRKQLNKTLGERGLQLYNGQYHLRQISIHLRNCQNL